jgi:hypothetical protein|mmetsp:Transcript_8148/g.32562  ORF Transcript_8148/g.32562 Transcript_8148/m.32562 type:complete len:82 (+) Transcript_8148:163-408(+)
MISESSRLKHRTRERARTLAVAATRVAKTRELVVGLGVVRIQAETRGEVALGGGEIAATDEGATATTQDARVVGRRAQILG